MAKKITGSDIAEIDIFKSIRDSAEKTISVIEKVNSEFIQTATVLKKGISNAKFASSKEIDDFSKSVGKANVLQKDSVKIQQELERLRALKVKADTEVQRLAQQELKTSQQQSNADAKQTKEIERQTKALTNEANAYKQLELQTRELKNESKKLGAEMLHLEQSGKRNTKEYRDLSRTYKEVTKSAQLGDAQLKKIDSTVGDNFRNVGNYNGAIGKLRNGLGQLGLAFGIGTVVMDAGRTLAKFDEASADVAKTVGITKDQARELSLELLKIDTRSSVEELQKIAGIGGQLGIAKGDIVSFTTATDKLNVALGDEFQGGAEEITKTIGGLRNVFGDIKSANVGEDLLHIGNALNALGASGSATSPIMADFAGRIGGVGIPLGLTTDEVLGLSATLEELNVSAERGGTAVTKVLQKMTVNTDEFAKMAGMPLKDFENLVNTDIYGAFQKVIEGTKKSGKNATELGKILDNLGLDGAGTSEVFLKLGSNMDLLDKRTKLAGESLTETNSITQEFNVKNETLSASLEKVSNAWDKFIIGADSATGASSIITKALSFLANNLGTIIGYIGKAVIAWGAYLVISKSIQAYNFVMSGGLKTVASRMLDVFKAGKQAGEGAKIAGEETKKAGKAMTTVPWMLIIGLVIELAMAFYDMASGAKEAREQQELLNQQIERGAKTATIVTENLSKLTAERIRLLDIEQRKRIANGENESAVIKDILNKKEGAFKAEQDFIDKSTKTLGETINQLEYYGKRAEQIGETAKKLKFKGGFKAGSELANQFNALKKIASEIGINPSAFDDVEDLAKAIKNHSEAQIAGNEKAIELLKIQRKQTSDNIDELKIQKLEKDKENEQDKTKLETKTKIIKATKEEIKLNEDLKKSLEDLWNTELEKTSSEETLLGLKKMAKDEELKLQWSLSTDLLNRDQQLKDALILNQIEFDRAMKNLKEGEDVVKAQTEVNKIQFKLNKASGLEAIALEFELLSAKHKLLDEELEAELLLAGNNEAEKLKLRSEYALKHQELDKEFKDRSIKTETEVVEKAKKSYEAQKEFIKLTADYFIKKSNEKIAQMDVEINKAQTQSDLYRGLAESGNITAKESLAEQQKIIAEANKVKAQEQKKQERIKMAESVYSAYIANQEKGEKNPLAKTISDITLLNQFISALPTFYEGTEGTVGDALGMPQLSGRDGHIVRVDGSEKILNPTLSKMTGNLSTGEIAKIAQEYQNGKLINAGNGAIQIGGSWQTELIVKELQSLKDVVANMPENNLAVGEITQTAFNILQTRKVGNITTRKIFKVK